jgi:glycerol-3-phosphate acyltransferase PlsY
MIVGLIIAVMILGYLLGSIPCGVLISKRFSQKDLLQVGSGKTGTTNVLRTAGKKAAALALIMDIGKGTLAVTFAGLVFSPHYAVTSGAIHWRDLAKVLSAASAITGHNWSVFLKFRGGRGVATFMGTLLGLYWPAGIVGGIFVLGLGFRTKYMSLGSIIGAVAAFVMLMAFTILEINVFGPYPPFEYSAFAAAGAIFIYIMHRDNITRLYNGTERKIGEKSRTDPVITTHHTE